MEFRDRRCHNKFRAICTEQSEQRIRRFQTKRNMDHQFLFQHDSARSATLSVHNGMDSSSSSPLQSRLSTLQLPTFWIPEGYFRCYTVHVVECPQCFVALQHNATKHECTSVAGHSSQHNITQHGMLPQYPTGTAKLM